jgi:3-hydroxyacyl-[acyl-carrier-protein] dehydratase
MRNGNSEGCWVKSGTSKGSLDILEIQKYSRNRYPFIMIDKVEEIVPGKTAKGYKNFSMNEWFFPTHYEDDPMVPGVLQIECLGQMFNLTFLTLPEYKGKASDFLETNNVRFSRHIIPGDRLDIDAELKSMRHGIARGSAVGYINGHLGCRAYFVMVITEILSQFTPPPPPRCDYLNKSHLSITSAVFPIKEAA